MDSLIALIIVIWLAPLATGLFKKQVLVGIAGSVASWIGSSMILRVIKTVLNREDIPREHATFALILAAIVISSVFVYFIIRRSGTSPHS